MKVFVHTRAFVRGFPLPSSAVMRNASNQNIVWVKTAPEKFEPRVVTVEPLDGVNVAVTQGLKRRGPCRHPRRHPHQPSAMRSH